MGLCRVLAASLGAGDGFVVLVHLTVGLVRPAVFVPRVGAVLGTVSFRLAILGLAVLVGAVVLIVYLDSDSLSRIDRFGKLQVKVDLQCVFVAPVSNVLNRDVNPTLFEIFDDTRKRAELVRQRHQPSPPLCSASASSKRSQSRSWSPLKQIYAPHRGQ